RAELQLGWDLAKEALDVLARPVRMVFAPLDGHDPPLFPHCPGEGHRQCPRTGAGLEHRHSGAYVGEHQDRADVLRVHDLGAPAHAEDEIGQARAQRQQPPPGRGLDPTPALEPDDGGMIQDSPVVLELTVDIQLQQVLATLPIDQEAGVSVLEDTHTAARDSMLTRVCWRSRQKAHTSAVVGCPHTEQATNSTFSSNSANAGWPRSRKPKRKFAFMPGDCSSRMFSHSLYRLMVFPAAIGHSSTSYSMPRRME